MKTKILEQLKTKYIALGLGDKAFIGVADFLSKTVKTEEEIPEVVKNSEGLLKAFSAETDRRVTEISAKNKTLEKKIEGLEKKTPTEKPPTGQEDEKIPAWAQKNADDLAELLKKQGLSEKLQQTTSLKNSVSAKMIAEGKIDKRLCDKVLSRIDISNDDTVDTLYTKSIAEFNELKTGFTPDGFVPENSKTPDSKKVMDEYFEGKKKEIKQEEDAQKAFLPKEED